MAVKAYLMTKTLVITGTTMVLVAAIGITAINRSPSKDSATKQETPTSTRAANEPTASSAANNSKSSGPKDSVNQSAVLLKPFGNFVSNHRPNLKNQPDEQSVCNTTPGADCKIKFSQTGTSKDLPAKTADSSGAVIWNWRLQDIGLTEGTWQITAVATFGDQTKTSQDALALTVTL